MKSYELKMVGFMSINFRRLTIGTFVMMILLILIVLWELNNNCVHPQICRFLYLFCEFDKILLTELNKVLVNVLINAV